MNVNEMHQYIQLKLQEVGAFSERVFYAEEIDVFINACIIKHIREKMPVNTTGIPFQKLSKLDDDIRTLYKTVIIDDLVKVEDDFYLMYQVTLPKDLLFKISFDIVSMLCSKAVKHKARVVTRESLYALLDSPYYSTSYRSPIVTLDENNLLIHTKNKFTPVKCEIAYIKEPVKVTLGEEYVTPISNVDSELPISCHTLICDKVVYDILEAIKSNRVQTNLTTNTL